MSKKKKMHGSLESISKVEELNNVKDPLLKTIQKPYAKNAKKYL